jgi:hypothetical protein
MISKGITLIELLISIAITVVIAGAIYFSLNAALESWGYSKDKLALQKVLNDVTEEITNGIADSYGLKDGLEIMTAGSARIEFVPPWTDDTHTVTRKDFVYTLNRKIKPGAAVPITELKLPGSTECLLASAALIDEKASPLSRVRLLEIASSGSQLRFTYHPDPDANADVIKAIWWDPGDKDVYSEYLGEVKNISKNPFGVEIVELKLRYYDNANNLVTEFEWTDRKDLNLITGIEVFVTAKLGQYKTSLLNFVSLRNAPMRSGYLPLRKGTSVSIPDSHNIHTFILSNISGVDNEDVLELEAIPESGKEWRIKIIFNRIGFSDPKIGKYTIEYPPGHPVYTAYPKTDATLGLNLLMLDSSGLYDYDDDEDIEDFVMLDGKVTLNIKKMDVEGVGLFIRP